MTTLNNCLLCLLSVLNHFTNRKQFTGFVRVILQIGTRRAWTSRVSFAGDSGGGCEIFLIAVSSLSLIQRWCVRRMHTDVACACLCWGRFHWGLTG